jgi:hypothetical protein
MGWIWNHYLLQYSKESDDFGNPNNIDSNETWNCVYDTRLVVILQGIPGLGKSLLASHLVESFSNIVISIEQDSFNGNGQKCQKAFKKLLENPQYKIIILARNNENIKQYARYTELADSYNCKVLAIYPEEMRIEDHNRETLKQICIQSVKERKGHSTFDIIPMEKRGNIVCSFYNQFKIASISHNVHFKRSISWLNKSGTRRPIEIIREEVIQYISQCIVLTPEPIYICLDIPSIIKDQLNQYVSHLDNNVKKKNDHLTLQFHTTKNMEMWRYLIELGNIYNIKVEIYKWIRYKNGHSIFLANIYKDNLLVNHWVESGYPHITASIPDGNKAKDSINLIKLYNHSTLDNLIESKTLSNPIIYNSSIQFVYPSLKL